MSLFGELEPTIQDKWRSRMFRAYQIAVNSPDPSTQNGAILINQKGNIVSEAWNAFPLGVKYTSERWERPLKYKIIEHAERNAIFQAAKYGIKTNDLIMVCCWAACSDCARAIIQAGIKTLVTHKQAADMAPDFWKQEVEIAMTMFSEAGVEVIIYDGKVGGPEIRHSGKIFIP